MKFSDILSQYDPETDNELEMIPIIGKQIAERMREHKHLSWTKFPEKFESCKTDSQLKEIAKHFNTWIEEVGMCRGDNNAQ